MIVTETILPSVAITIASGCKKPQSLVGIEIRIFPFTASGNSDILVLTCFLL